MLFKDFLDKIPNDFLFNYNEFNNMMLGGKLTETELLINRFLYNLRCESIKKIKIFKMDGAYYPLEYDIELSILKNIVSEEDWTIFFDSEFNTVENIADLYNWDDIWKINIDIIEFTDLVDIQRGLILDLKRDITSNEYYKEKVSLYISNLKEKELSLRDKSNLNSIEKEILYNIFLAYTTTARTNWYKTIRINKDIGKINELIKELECFSEDRFISMLMDLDLIYEDLNSIFQHSTFNMIYIIARIYGYADRNHLAVKNIKEVIDGIKNSDLYKMNMQLEKLKIGMTEKRYEYFFKALKPFMLNDEDMVYWGEADPFAKEVSFKKGGI